MSAGNTTLLPILFIFFSLFLGIIVSYLISRSRYSAFLPPETVLVFLLGICLSLLSETMVNERGSEDALMLAIHQFVRMDAEAILYIFLPVLLFGEAMTLNFYQVKKAVASVLLLAFPGASFMSWLLAIFTYKTLNLGWSWRLCWVLGAVLCTTDPINVVATLKELSSTSPSALKLTYLISGESLLNDGAALVILEALIDTQYSTTLAIVIYFVKVIFISPLFGLAFGLFCVLGLKILNRRLSNKDATMQMILTIATAYLSFFLPQYVLSIL